MVKITTQPNCPWCDKAKALLAAHGFTVDQTTVLDTPQKQAAFKAAGFATVPQIWIDGRHVGGHDDLVTYLETRNA